MKRILLHGIFSGILAAVAAIIYFHIYQNTLYTAFNKIVNAGSITGACMFGDALIAVAYMLLKKLNKESLKGWLNIFVAVLSFASIFGPISMCLPLDIKTPELFPGLVVPMHFFPAMAFFCLSPFFEE